MPRQLSTSLSDLMLAISAFYVSHYWYGRNYNYAAFGMFIQACAASMGIFRFAMEEPQGTLIYKAHKLLSWSAGAVGVPMIALMFCNRYGSSALANKISIFVVCILLVVSFLPPKNRELCSQAVSGFSILTMATLCTLNKNWFGFGACFVYAAAGILFGSDGTLLDIPKVDFLHYFLIVGNTMFKLAL
ncbi:uncharacterized protein LOC132559678 [Ylistrum balloti]|uniref:uncharacterized protein LOC132559678 n=1 Tax=Ylistrum balloti TaxID=509963 RepID=UPI002905B1D8|nr:uncharacterized protein LOC132559678 [Ylistrum balloti]XP_060080279.1 uncharacterized protein LOC132559678 [Ylistrum balloti]